MTKKQVPTNNRTVALCYVRLSVAPRPEEENSPERQRDNIRKVCEAKGWQMEWYEDVGGHRSGTSEKNRPAWARLKKRLTDSDVVALVANDLSRIFRKGWRIGSLTEMLESYGVHLVLAAPGRSQIDTSDQQSRIILHFTSLIDEQYATDAAIRARDSINHRKARGLTVGPPPFGTTRDDKGLLIPTTAGAWLLPNGKFQAGTQDDTPPEADAVWRGYYDAAHELLKLYAQGNIGLEKLAYQLNDDGWAFRDRKGQPRPFERGDIRRVVANWPEYGGLPQDRKAKDRPAYEDTEAEITLDAERAVFPVDLLRQVAQTRNKRSVRPTNHGVNRQVRIYPLAGITYCDHCEALAVENEEPALRTRLSGHTGKIMRYRHKPGVKCGCSNRSVPREAYEADFRKLIGLLTVDTSAIDLMTELAIQADRNNNPQEQQDLEKQKAEAIAKAHRRIEAARQVFLDGDISREEYVLRREQAEREITHWEARTTETEKIALELSACMTAINNLVNVWDNGTDEDKRGFAQHLFEYVVYNLDTRRIVDFRLIPWAERYLVLRAALYHDEAHNQKPATKGGYTEMPRRRLELLFSP